MRPGLAACVILGMVALALTGKQFRLRGPLLVISATSYVQGIHS